MDAAVDRWSLAACSSPREAFVIQTIRRHILNRYSWLAEIVRERFPTDPAGEDAFSYAFELYLRALPHLGVTVDGWRMLRIVDETRTSLRAVGIMHILPAGERPLEVDLCREGGSIRYRLRVGMDARWNSLSDSKRWKAVYIYASGERDEEWTWSEPIASCLADA